MTINEKAPAEIIGAAEKVFPQAPKFGWRDITSQVVVRGVGANDPTWTQMGTSSFFGFAFAVNDEAWFTFHIPHDFTPDSPIHLHAHYALDGTNVSPVKWEWTYSYADGFNQEAFNVAANGTVITQEQVPAGIAWQHMIAETAEIFAGIAEPDGLIMVRLRRVANGATDNTDTVFLLTSDVHYQSTDRSTINKAPDFYNN